MVAQAIDNAAGLEFAPGALAALRQQYQALAAFREAVPRSVEDLKAYVLLRCFACTPPPLRSPPTPLMTSAPPLLASAPWRSPCPDSALNPRTDPEQTSDAAVRPPGFDTAFLRPKLSPHVPRMKPLMSATEAYVAPGLHRAAVQVR